MNMKMDVYREILENEKNFRYMIAANLISRFGDSVDAIAYSWMVYQLTGSTAWLSVILGVNMIPTVLFQPLGGGLTEYFRKKRVIVICDIARGAVVFLTGVCMLTGVLRPWHLLIFTFVNSSIEALRIPNGLAILPQILKKENYKAAISMDQGVRRTSELIGMGCAGIIIGWLGIGGALFVDAVTFLASGLLLSFLQVNEEKRKNVRFQIQGYAGTLKEGFVYFKKSELAVMVCVICVVQNLCTLPIENLQAAYISEYLRLDVFAMSVGGTAITIGMILGALCLPAVSQKISEKRLLIQGGILIGILYFIYIMIGMIPVDAGKYISYFAAAFVFGVLNSMIGVTVQVIFVSRIPEEFVGRISGIFNALACSSLPVGSFLLAGLSAFFTIAELYLLTGTLSIAAFIFIGRSKGGRKIEKG
ncbi:MFS transporter [Lachnospiraceae bacterium]|nr:MFS transporter [uncultured Schaedlerella sp.]MCI9152515.1 MFS transporter [Ruminococcus sp.]NBI59609.1 MFS transporter [Lachnospiraceae bacterium]